jgi:hypothetical protein
MTVNEAVKECELWLAYLDRQRERTREMQRAASIARRGDTTQARKIRNQLDSQPRVFDGTKLEEAIRILLNVHIS